MCTYQLRLRPGSQPQLGVFPGEASRFQRAADDQQQAVRFERLLYEVIGAVLNAFTAVSIVPWPLIITTGTCGSSVCSAFRMPSPSSLDPCNHTSNTTRFGLREREGGDGAVRISRLPRLITLILQNPVDQQSDIRLVIDDQYFLGHPALFLHHVHGLRR